VATWRDPEANEPFYLFLARDERVAAPLREQLNAFQTGAAGRAQLRFGGC
jgi:hypothetical protein